MDERTPRENAPVAGRQYMLTGKKGDKCILNGNTWEESEVKTDLHTGKAPS